MKIFWPHRSKAKGFSIQSLASRYRLKISNASSNQFLDDRDLISVKEEAKENSMNNLSTKRTHWANRDFSEYKETA